jgi:hypothetical protein
MSDGEKKKKKERTKKAMRAWSTPKAHHTPLRGEKGDVFQTHWAWQHVLQTNVQSELSECKEE